MPLSAATSLICQLGLTADGTHKHTDWSLFKFPSETSHFPAESRTTSTSILPSGVPMADQPPLEPFLSQQQVTHVRIVLFLCAL